MWEYFRHARLLAHFCNPLINQSLVRLQLNLKCRNCAFKLKQNSNFYAISSFHTSAFNFKRRKTSEERKSFRIIEYAPKAKGEIVEIWKDITAQELSKILHIDIQTTKQLFPTKITDPNTCLADMKEIQLLIKRCGKRMRIVENPHNAKKEISDLEELDAFPRPPPSKIELKPRPPVITVMGHVDHGKTTLLDALRKSSVVEQEHGGITQHIGAFSVLLASGAKITFLDTPGHAAFTAMRERGANLTDIVLLVVAADDGVMEQTLESIRMAKDANVPIMVAINKIDAAGADIHRTENMLIKAGIQVENLGGDVQAIPISALKKQNLDQLMEALVVQAELLEVGGDPTGLVEAVVVESRLDQNKGKICTLIVQRGTLKKGAILIAGQAMGKVRNLRSAEGVLLKEVEPGFPAEVEGWKDLPAAGEVVLEVESEKRARVVIKVRENKAQQQKLNKDAEVIAIKEEQHNIQYKEKLEMKRKMGRYKLRREGPRKPEIPEDNIGPYLNLIVKTDVDGTLEAILDTLDTYDAMDQCKLDFLHYAVGPITENDLEMAKTFNGVIYAFNVECPEKIKKLAEDLEVVIKSHNIIYKLVDDIKAEINSRLPTKEVETILGEANVLQQFEINEGRKKVPVAGCLCTQGVLKKAALYRLKRNDQIIYEGLLSSMRHLKNEVDVIRSDTECGLQLGDINIKFKVGDTLICLEKRQEPQVTTWNPGF